MQRACSFWLSCCHHVHALSCMYNFVHICALSCYLECTSMYSPFWNGDLRASDVCECECWLLFIQIFMEHNLLPKLQLNIAINHFCNGNTSQHINILSCCCCVAFLAGNQLFDFSCHRALFNLLFIYN